MCSPDAFLAILAVLFPPIAVWIKVGVCSADSLINIALCCLGYVPGLLHAWYIILKYPEADDEYPDGYRPIVGHGQRGDAEAGRVTYYYIAHEQAHPNQHHHQQQQQQQQQQRSYGTNVNPESRAAPPPPVPQKPHQNGGVPDQGSSSRPEGEHRAPPTYAEAVKGDNKIQS
ncbi:stress response RCI peptide [Trichophyton equinum CBS 127.97]|uniref:Stress response RCI peptide n=1 Tax=Trichophyton equinum (strain ATCC MYA-4606 / CBS 127.97) TaxID=559882 RepID=F2PK41_TRIEC|nr:stress response RCI peptide [Trichophyton equinum CBS 127.97]